MHRRTRSAIAKKRNRRERILCKSRRRESLPRIALLPNSPCVLDDLTMSFFVSHRMGGDDQDPPLDSLEQLLDELDEDPHDGEHRNVAVIHESDWCLGVYPGWKLILENLEDLETSPRHLVVGRDRQYVLSLMHAAAQGDLELLERQPWRSGY